MGDFFWRAVKILESYAGADRLEKKINKFIEEEQVNVIKVQLSAGLFSVMALIEYEDNYGS
ncbi:hypothetical protein KFZ58_05530 [Virgibacillus sp. NKC19-16]|uniref:hypothetical protein n=1 Tax=Virgibacillus salidurans TaxID=2831673 RepID=UPI001F196FD3|nr:hypothetical protein [Virgibacillus sp. NKC19-16]UJL47354.1 hypothetical protein KFZ58_05530 [Virgibacillus sp. NKC19-16]